MPRDSRLSPNFPRSLKIFFDGGCQPNPGMMEAAVVVRGEIHHRPALGQGSNSEAEWIALLLALEVAGDMGADDVEALGDSAMVIAQANGRAKCRAPELQRHLDAFREQAPLFGRLRVRHLRRNQNLAGIALQKVLKPY